MSGVTTQGGLAEGIRRRLGECSPAERKVGRVLLAAYPSAGFETVARLAERAGVSGPTVVRFVNRLGFRGFPDFQQALREELAERTASPVELYTAALVDGADAARVLAAAGEVAVEAVRRTFAALPPHDLAQAVAMLADPGRRVHLTGGRFSYLLARYLFQHLAQLRDGVFELPQRAAPRASSVTGIGGKDVLVIFDHRRYEEASLALAAYAKKRHAKIVLFTDSFLSPIAASADVVLPGDTGSGASPYDAMTPTLAVVEAVVAGVVATLGEAAHVRMARTEQVATELSLY
jgi:DNA-binding MurR/RpiR family transcriptional regulator